jgi:hypothetical protein
MSLLGRFGRLHCSWMRYADYGGGGTGLRSKPQIYVIQNGRSCAVQIHFLHRNGERGANDGQWEAMEGGFLRRPKARQGIYSGSCSVQKTHDDMQVKEIHTYSKRLSDLSNSTASMHQRNVIMIDYAHSGQRSLNAPPAYRGDHGNWSRPYRASVMKRTRATVERPKRYDKFILSINALSALLETSRGGKSRVPPE